MTSNQPAPWPADEVERRKVADLKLIPGNPHTHSQDQVMQVVAAIREFGWTIPVLIDDQDNIIAGEGRWLAAQTLALDDIPVVVARGWTEAQKRAYRLLDNKLPQNAPWDVELLRVELAALSALDFDLSLTGFSGAELADLLAERTEGNTDPDDAPPAPENPVSQLGDAWLMGRHRIVCGDSTKAEVVAKALNGVEPHLMVTDPPYGVKYDPKWRKEAGVASEGVATGVVLNDDRADWREAWALFPGSVAYVWHGGLHSGVVAESLLACKMEIRAQIVWVKTRPALSRGHYHWQHEPAMYAVKSDAEDQWRYVPEHELTAYAVKKGMTANWLGDRKQSTVWFIEHLKNDTGHGTQKPVECMKRPIENNSSPGQAVYEPFSGSGTTLIACEMTGRVCHAIELNPAYVDVAVQRWEAFTGKKATLEGDGRTFAEVAARRAVPEAAE